MSQKLAHCHLERSHERYTTSWLYTDLVLIPCIFCHILGQTGYTWILGHYSWNNYFTCLNFGILKDLTRIQTQRESTVYSGILEQIKPCNSLVREAKFSLSAAANHLTISPEGYSRRQSKVLNANSMAKLLEQSSSTACPGWTASTNTTWRRIQVGCSLCWTLLARLWLGKGAVTLAILLVL